MTPILLASYPVMEKNHLTFSLLLITLFLISHFDKSKKTHLYLASVISTLFLLLQHNAVFITAPLLLYTFGAKRFWIPLSLSMLSAFIITSIITDRRAHPVQGVFLHDIWAIAHTQDRYPLKDTHLDLSDKYDKSEMLALYTPISHNSIIWNSTLRDQIMVFNDFPKFMLTFKVWLKEIT